MKYYIISEVSELKGIILNDARVMTPAEAASTEWVQATTGSLHLTTVDSLEQAVKECIKNGTLLFARNLLVAASDLQGQLSCELFSSKDIVKATQAADDLTLLHTAVLVLKCTIEEFTNENFSWWKEEWLDATMEEILIDYRGF